MLLLDVDTLPVVRFVAARLDEQEEFIRSTQRTGGRGMLAVEVLRRILERHQDCGKGHGRCDDGGHATGYGGDVVGCPDLMDLAALWPEHADYDVRWY